MGVVRDLRGDTLHFRIRLGNRYARSQASVTIIIVLVPILSSAGRVKREPNVDLSRTIVTRYGKIEPRRHYPRDCVYAAIERDGLAHHSGIGAQTLPERMGYHGDGRLWVTEPLPNPRIHSQVVHQGGVTSTPLMYCGGPGAVRL